MLQPRSWFKHGELQAHHLTTHHSFLKSPYPHSKPHTWSIRLGISSFNNASGEEIVSNTLHLVVIPEDVRKRFMDEHPTEDASSFYRLLHKRLGQPTLPAYLNDITVTAPLQTLYWYNEGIFVTFRCAETDFSNQHMRFTLQQNKEPLPQVVTPTLRILCGDFSNASSPAPLTVGAALHFRYFDKDLFDFKAAGSNVDVSLFKAAILEYTFKCLNVTELRARNMNSVESNTVSGNAMLCFKSRRCPYLQIYKS
jgi:hypothetical protein